MINSVSIKNFGPIEFAEVNLDTKFQIFIGEQASGKSTICKVVYFCQKVRDYTLEYLSDPKRFLENHQNEYFANYLKFLTGKFMGCFGTTKHMEKFEIVYSFQGNRIIITLNEDGYVRFSLSKSIREAVLSLIDEANHIYSNQIDSSMAVLDYIKILDMMQKQLKERLMIVFCNDSDVVYIPAGRSLLSTMSEQLQDVSVSGLDLTMQEFIKLIRSTKSKFGSRIPDMIQAYTKTIKGQINNSATDQAYELIKRILKADYISEEDGEKIYFNSKQWVRLMYSSSGQQEALWILMIAFSIILERKKTFIIIEEPEAHLFPMAQRDIVSLISLMVNAGNSRCIITTHSPYILTSANILLYSSYAEKNLSKSIKIPRSVRIPYTSFDAFKVETKEARDHYMTSLMDEDTHMISLDYIDEVSAVTNNELYEMI